MKKIILFSLAAAVLAAILVTSLPATQSEATGMLRGVVTDPSGAVIPAAAVTVSAGRFTRTVSTDESGQYVIAGLAQGHYRVQVSAPGFSSFDRSGFVVSSGSLTEANAQLAISAPKQEITVSD